MEIKRLPLALTAAFLAAQVLLSACAPCGPAGCAIDQAASSASIPTTVPAAPPPPPVVGDGPWNLTLFHLNDTHTAFTPEPATWRDDHALVGGVIALQSHLVEQRAAAAPSLTFDAGDLMTGNPISEMEVNGVLGGAWIAMLNTLGIDAGVIGNHDFDQGRPNARALAAASSWPMMALDLYDEHGKLEIPQEPVVIERGGLRVGVIGVTCAGLFDVTADSRVAGLELVDQEPVVRRWIEEIDPETDLIVLITHNGIEGDLGLAEHLAGSGLDVIVGGHSHTRTREPRLVGGILVVQAGGHVQNLGRLDLRVEDDRVVEYDGRLISLLAAGRTADAELTALADRYAAEVDAEFGRVLATLSTDWRRDSRGESNVGNWVCDRLMERAGADVALLNSGTLRQNFTAGPVTKLQLNQLMPFGNLLEIFEVVGAELERICLVNARAAESGEHGILQVGGLRYAYTVEGEDVRLLETSIGGQPIDPEHVYTVACPDYVAMKAELYMDMPVPPTRSTGVTITQALVEAVEAVGTANMTIDATTDGRIARR